MCCIYAISANAFLLCFILCLLIIHEIYSAFRKKIFISPNFLFTLGWTLPLLIAQYPVNEIVHIVDNVGFKSNLLSIGVVFIFYLTQIIQPRGRFNIGFNSIQISYWFPILCFFLSNLGFILALYFNGWIIPVFQVEITESAKEFFQVPGTATLLHLGNVGVIYTLLIYYKQERKVTKRLKLFIFLTVIFVIELLLYGKRMGAILVLLFILLSLIPLLSRKKTVKYAFLIFILFLGNAFLRLNFAFKEYYSTANTSVTDIYTFTLLQPILYIQPNFGNLNTIVENNKSDLYLGRYSFPFLHFLIGDSHIEDNNIYNKVKKKAYNMTTFVSSFYMDFGFFGSLIMFSMLFYVIFVFYSLAKNSSYGLIIYAYFASRIPLLFTANLFFEPIFLRNLLIIFLLFLLFNNKNGYK